MADEHEMAIARFQARPAAEFAQRLSAQLRPARVDPDGTPGHRLRVPRGSGASLRFLVAPVDLGPKTRGHTIASQGFIHRPGIE